MNTALKASFVFSTSIWHAAYVETKERRKEAKNVYLIIKHTTSTTQQRLNVIYLVQAHCSQESDHHRETLPSSHRRGWSGSNRVGYEVHWTGRWLPQCVLPHGQHPLPGWCPSITTLKEKQLKMLKSTRKEGVFGGNQFSFGNFTSTIFISLSSRFPPQSSPSLPFPFSPFPLPLSLLPPSFPLYLFYFPWCLLIVCCWKVWVWRISQCGEILCDRVKFNQWGLKKKVNESSLQRVV